MNTQKKRKHMLLFTGKAHWTGKTLWNFEPNYRQKLEYVEKIKKFLQAWSSRGSIFLKKKSRTRIGSILRCNSSSDCVEAFDHVCPPVSLGWVVVGGWTKIANRLEGPSPEVFLSVCSSKLEASQAFVQRLQLFLKMGAEASTFFISNVFCSKLGVADS